MGEGIDGDYSGRPLGRPAREEIRQAGPPLPPRDHIARHLKDGGEALRGPDRRFYYEHFVDGVQVWDRPVPDEDLA